MGWAGSPEPAWTGKPAAVPVARGDGARLASLAQAYIQLARAPTMTTCAFPGNPQYLELPPVARSGCAGRNSVLELRVSALDGVPPEGRTGVPWLWAERRAGPWQFLGRACEAG